jgi:hypothetical protein
MVFTYIHRDSGKSHVMSLVDSNFTVKLQTSTLIANNTTTGTEAMKVLRKQKRTYFVLYVFDFSLCMFFSLSYLSISLLKEDEILITIKHIMRLKHQRSQHFSQSYQTYFSLQCLQTL